MARVASSNLTNVEYDEKKQEMTVQFLKKGNIYVYSDVPKEVYEALRNAPSPGSYLHQNVKGVYPFRRLA